MLWYSKYPYRYRDALLQRISVSLSRYIRFFNIVYNPHTNEYIYRRIIYSLYLNFVLHKLNKCNVITDKLSISSVITVKLGNSNVITDKLSYSNIIIDKLNNSNVITD